MDILWECLRDAILSVINPMCPLNTFNVPEVKEPWITNQALEAIRDKDKLMKKAKRAKVSEHWARMSVGSELENLKIDYLKNQQFIHKSFGEVKPLFSRVKKIIMKYLAERYHLRGQQDIQTMNNFFMYILGLTTQVVLQSCSRLVIRQLEWS